MLEQSCRFELDTVRLRQLYTLVQELHAESGKGGWAALHRQASPAMCISFLLDNVPQCGLHHDSIISRSHTVCSSLESAT